MSKGTENCGNCYYFNQDGKEDNFGGLPCLRYPSYNGKLKTDWCGEHRNEVLTNYKLEISTGKEVKGELY